jgi:RNA polymerase sigma factor (sigma-70 family)
VADNTKVMDADSDAAVIAASLTDSSQFGALFDRHATVLFRYLVRRVGPHEADALLGELFRIAFERRASFDTSRADARPWLYGIATRLLSNQRRSEVRRMHATARLLSRTPAVDDVIDPIAARLDAAAAWPTVAEAMGELPEIERSALLLHVWEGLSYDEIATSLEIPVGTVRSRINRARKRMRELAADAGIATTTRGRMER